MLGADPGRPEVTLTSSPFRSTVALVSRLLLVRHGQASVNGPDYDVLSELGAEQARALGARWAAEHAVGRLTIDAFYRGPQRRHDETATHLRAAAAEGGLELTELTAVSYTHLTLPTKRIV